ncbi:MAG: hypothetical protein LRY71_16970, partial [Bacillaceae bacterium]|nr:hypothetical protein [Bacillaceae bacterium]
VKDILKSYYLEWIITELNNALLNGEEQFEKIEKAMQIFASELLGKGWSVEELYSSIFELILNDKHSVDKKFEGFFAKLSSEPLPYVFLFAVKKNLANETKVRLVELNLEFLSGEEVLNTYSDYELDKNLTRKKEICKGYSTRFRCPFRCE